MTFVSLEWLLWMWLTVGLYWLVPGQFRIPLLAALTILFLAIHSPVSALLLMALTAVTHAVGGQNRIGTRLLVVGILAIVAPLITFKVGAAIDPADLVHGAAIPLGLSYYSFRCIHYLLERYSERLNRLDAKTLVGYLFFLPTLVVGPIHRADDYQRDLKRQRFDPLLLSEGLERIIYGFAKITILSNLLTQRIFGDAIAGLSDGIGSDRPLIIYLTIVQNGLNIYFQFAGHSDIAIGFARLLGFRVLENFNFPYLQPNISAFWRSWHISLSRWCRSYIYDPVVGWTRRPALGALATMIVIGLWHEISLRFLLWGLYHGLGIVVWQQFRALMPAVGRQGAVRSILSVVLTVHFVWFGFVILTADGVFDALETYRKLLFGWM